MCVTVRELSCSQPTNGSQLIFTSYRTVLYYIQIRLSMTSFYFHNNFEWWNVFFLVSGGTESMSDVPKVIADNCRADLAYVSSDS